MPQGYTTRRKAFMVVFSVRSETADGAHIFILIVINAHEIILVHTPSCSICNSNLTGSYRTRLFLVTPGETAWHGDGISVTPSRHHGVKSKQGLALITHVPQHISPILNNLWTVDKASHTPTCNPLIIKSYTAQHDDNLRCGRENVWMDDKHSKQLWKL